MNGRHRHISLLTIPREVTGGQSCELDFSLASSSADMATPSKDMGVSTPTLSVGNGPRSREVIEATGMGRAILGGGNCNKASSLCCAAWPAMVGRLLCGGLSRGKKDGL
jgi:hypothetical protein